MNARVTQGWTRGATQWVICTQLQTYNQRLPLTL